MNEGIQEMVDGLEKQCTLLQKEGTPLIYQRIKEFLDKGQEIEPIVDIDAIQTQIHFYKIQEDQNTETGRFLGNVLNDYLAKCFKIKLLEYRLYLKNK